MKRCIEKHNSKIAFLSLSLFILLAIAVKFDLFNELNTMLYNAIQEHRSASLYKVGIIFGDLFGSIGSLVLFLGMIAVLLRLRKKEEFLFSVLLAGLSVGATILLKYSLQVHRPLHSINGLTGYAFPSGHGVLNIVIAVVLYILVTSTIQNKLLLEVVKFFLVIFILLGIFFRVYIESHWLADILGSLLLVIFVYALSCSLLKAIKYRISI